MRLLGLSVMALLAAPVASACVVTPRSANAEVQFDETVNLGYTCASGVLSHWQVSCRETGDMGTGGCQQPILFTNLSADRTYTFDIAGYTTLGGSGERLCWTGSCSVRTDNGGTKYPDCSPQVQHLCPY